ncbi:hypothetical protein D9619_007411 [Psilocybe cf. subviscida]|uniref:Amidohydrolase-related domain-containing protein n=1 Tax=Psilocybe cf. subviscida TaxID=2480587 RepID=A0A8H5B2B1_9AGAR|nr:hypothetical protein D9619_007411 [Psilocybe cf. subviscida]
MFLVRATFVHTPELDVLEVLHNYLAAIDDDGHISYLGPFNSNESTAFLSGISKGVELVNVPEGSFILPTFSDLHLHAPQFLYQGTGLDLPLMQWLDNYALKAELRLDNDPILARRVYTRLASRLKENGTGTVLLFGTIKEETNLILAQCMQAAGLRGFVGKLSMDVDITSPGSASKTYIEDSASEALKSARSFVRRCQHMQEHLPAAQRLVEPVLTPRFVPTCSEELLNGLGRMSEELGVKVQSHMAEAKDQVEWVRALRGMEDVEVFDKNGLLTPRTIQAHCTFLSPTELSLVSERGTAIAHCPLSNAYFSAQPFPLREALGRGAKVGLGTDIAGGYSADIMNAMRQAVAVSRMREGERVMSLPTAQKDQAKEEPEAQKRSIDWKEALFLATRGGALCLGLPGVFRVGAPFDAQQIRLYDPANGRGFGAVDYFDLETDLADTSIMDEENRKGTSAPSVALAQQEHLQKGRQKGEQHQPQEHQTYEHQPLADHELIEKWWSVGDNRNRSAVWVQGKLIWVSP